jgi:small subunit ribosomal protein S3
LHYLLARLDLLYLPREIIPKLLNRLFPRKFIGRRAFNRNKHKVGFVKKPLVRGIMFKCAGRFSRAQMASYQVYKQGCMPLSTIKHNIKYAFGTVSLKYGSLGLKVFIFG